VSLPLTIQGGRLRAGAAAEPILVWLFDEVTFARVVAIASSVTAGIIARLFLQPVGLLRRMSRYRADAVTVLRSLDPPNRN
jgi:hypothetical protein